MRYMKDSYIPSSPFLRVHRDSKKEIQILTNQSINIHLFTLNKVFQIVHHLPECQIKPLGIGKVLFQNYLWQVEPKRIKQLTFFIKAII